MKSKGILQILKETFSEILNRDFKRLAAALAHYMSFSVIPALIVVAAISATVLDDREIQENIIAPVEEVTNEETAQTVEDAINATRNGVGTNPITTLVGAITLLYGASRMFRHLKYSINYLWEVPQENRGGIEQYLRDSAISMVFVIIFGVLLVLILIAQAAFFAAFQTLDDILPNIPLISVVQVAGIGTLFLLMTMLFTIAFRFLPEADVGWRDAWVGAAVTALFFTLGQLVLGLYLDVVDVSSTYGTAHTIIVLLIWVYVTSHLVLFGAKFTYLYANRLGDEIEPEVEKHDIEEPGPDRTRVPVAEAD